MAKYEELQALVEVFRAYVSAVKIVRTAPQICSGISPDPTDAEKVASPLPDHHPHEMFVTKAFNSELAEHKDRDEVAWQSRSGLR